MQDESVYRNSFSRWYVTGFMTFVFLVEIPSVFDGGKGGDVARALASSICVMAGVFAVRAFKGGLFVKNDGITLREILKTRHWNKDEIDHFEAKDVQIGMLKVSRRAVVLRDQKGNENILEAVNGRIPRDDQTSWVDNCVNELNARYRL